MPSGGGMRYPYIQRAARPEIPRTPEKGDIDHSRRKIMAIQPVPLTREGMAKLSAELEYLQTVKRQEVAEHIHEEWESDAARDNVPSYDYAKSEQAMLEGRIQELDHLLRHAQIINEDGRRPTDRVALGATVSLESAGGGQRSFTIVGSAEANPSAGRISNTSPVGSALLGKRVGESVEVKVPAGVQRFTVTSIE
jgi:transcription elongation factor GreA